MSADMSPYCSAHDEWLIMKLYMYVGYHDANNVSNFGGDPVTQLRDHAQAAGVWKTVAGHTSLSTTLVLLLRLLVWKSIPDNVKEQIR